MSAGTAAKNGHADRLDPVAWPRRGSRRRLPRASTGAGPSMPPARCSMRSASTSTSESLRETPRRMAGVLRRAAHAGAVQRRRRSPTTAATTSSSSRATSRSTRCASTTCCRSCGVAHVGYLPGERIVGLSKLARVVDLFARALQVQERLTTQIAGWLERELAPQGVGVVLEAEHLCMSLRGVQKPGATTVTSALHGARARRPAHPPGVPGADREDRSMSERQTARDRRRRPRRREGRRGAARGGLRGPRRPDRRGAGAALRAPAAVEGLPARRVAARECPRPSRRRSTTEHDIELRTGTAGRADRHRRRARSCSPAASGSAVRRACCSRPAPSRAGSTSPAPTSTACSTCATSPTADALARALEQRRARRRHRRRLDRRRGRRLGAAARASRSTLVERAEVPLEHVLGREVGAIYADVHRDHGVELLAGRGASKRFEGDGRVERVRLADGRRGRLRPRRRRRRRRAAHRARRGGRARDRQRHRRRRAARDERARRLRGRRRRQRAPPVLRRRAARRALGERARPGPRRPRADARQAGRLATSCRTSSPTSTTSGWSTRATRASGTRSSFRGDLDARASSSPSGSSDEPRRRRHERQRLGRRPTTIKALIRSRRAGRARAPARSRRRRSTARRG